MGLTINFCPVHSHICIYTVFVEISLVDQIETIVEMFYDILDEELIAVKKKTGFLLFVQKVIIL